MVTKDKILQTIKLHEKTQHMGITVDDLCMLEKINQKEAEDSIRELYIEGKVSKKENLFTGEIRFLTVPYRPNPLI